MKATRTESEGIDAIEREMNRMLESGSDSYASGRRIWEIAFTHAPDSPKVMWPLWLIWGALTDRVEVKPQECAAAEQMMLRASREWLALDRRDEKARDAYLDRWVYDELGIERKTS
jgi:hypothetical protein